MEITKKIILFLPFFMVSFQGHPLDRNKVNVGDLKEKPEIVLKFNEGLKYIYRSEASPASSPTYFQNDRCMIFGERYLEVNEALKVNEINEAVQGNRFTIIDLIELYSRKNHTLDLGDLELMVVYDGSFRGVNRKYFFRIEVDNVKIEDASLSEIEEICDDIFTFEEYNPPVVEGPPKKVGWIEGIINRTVEIIQNIGDNNQSQQNAKNSTTVNDTQRNLQSQKEGNEDVSGGESSRANSQGR